MSQAPPERAHTQPRTSSAVRTDETSQEEASYNRPLPRHVINDCELLGFILAHPNIRQRARYIQRFLRPSDQHRLCVHVANILRGSRSHRLGNEKLFRSVVGALTPQKKAVKRLLKRVQDKRARKNWDLNKQKGGMHCTHSILHSH